MHCYKTILYYDSTMLLNTIISAVLYYGACNADLARNVRPKEEFFFILLAGTPIARDVRSEDVCLTTILYYPTLLYYYTTIIY